ncbi:MAG: hypothetical protein F6K11_02030 [Leptolyngbya sp. SIO3F4]|nr:hypothetical protein [Leptolyngbya sp. SIO3F4]
MVLLLKTTVTQENSAWHPIDKDLVTFTSRDGNKAYTQVPTNLAPIL